MDDSNKNKLIKLENLNKFKELIIEKIISPIVTNITNLQKSLENKAEKTHNHTIKDVTNLQTTLDGKAPEKYNLHITCHVYQLVPMQFHYCIEAYKHL